MDDEIRDRFRLDRSGRSDPYTYGRPARRGQGAPRQNTPATRPASPAPQPTTVAPALNPKPTPPVNQAQRPAPKPASGTELSANFDLYPAKKTQSKRSKKKPKTGRKRKFTKKKLIVLLLVVLLIAGGVAGAYYYRGHKNSANQTASTSTTPDNSAATPAKKRTGTVRLVAVGDSLAFDSLTNAAKKSDGNYDYAPMMANFKPLFEKADVRVCNETTPGGGTTDGLALSGYPTFNGPTGWNTGFADTGCNVMNLASEHTNDKGQTAINNMLKTWGSQKNMLAVAGANSSAEEQSKIRYMTVKDVKIAYLAYTASSANKDMQPYSVNVYSDALVDQQITEARKTANLIIVSMNWGSENGADVSAEQEKIAQHLADQNADVILGGGPRVLQPAKILSGKNGHQTLVWFSLGNFLNSMLGNNNLIGGMAVMDFDADTLKLNNPKLMPVYMHYEWTAAQKASNNVAARTNFKLYPLDQAESVLPKSQMNSSVAALTTQVTGIITKFVPITIISSSQY